jgi:hypothetical protein
LSIFKKEKQLTFNLALLLFFSFFTSAGDLFPCKVDESKEIESFFNEAKIDFYKGDLNSSYKNLTLLKPFLNDEEYRKYLFFTIVGLGEYFDAVNFLKDNSSSKEKFLTNLLLKRDCLNMKPKFEIKENFYIPKQIARKVRATIFDGESNIILDEKTCYKFDKNGKIVDSFPVMNGREISINHRGELVILSKDSVYMEKSRIYLPNEIEVPISLCSAPYDNYYILDGKGKVFLVDSSGKILEERQILIENAIKIRTDSLFRIFILSKDGVLYVYDASFNPLITMSEKLKINDIGKIEDFFVDYFGNPILLDKSNAIYIFNYSQNFLGKFYDEKFKVKSFYFDGGDFLIAVDKNGLVRKFQL